MTIERDSFPLRRRVTNPNRTPKRDVEHARAYARVLLSGLDPADTERPTVRRACEAGGSNAARPCPFVSCEYHLYLDVNEASGSLKENFPRLDVWELDESCALDVAERGVSTLDEVGAVMNLTRERIRQIETQGMAKLKASAEVARIAELLDGAGAA